MFHLLVDYSPKARFRARSISIADCRFRNAEFVDRTYIPQSLPAVGRRIHQSEIMLVGF